MPGEQQQRRGEASQRAPPKSDLSRGPPQIQPPVRSIETTPQASSLQPAPSTLHPSRSPATALAPVFRLPDSPRSAGGAAGSHKAAKVAIPKLKRAFDASAEDASSSGGRHRVTHACEPCRHRKTKCSGERPVCRHCQDFKIACFYADGKRDRVKK